MELSRLEAAELVEAVIEEICATIARGDDVKISYFGSFHIRHKNERLGRNPVTMEDIPISRRRVVVFKRSIGLADRIQAAHVRRIG